MIEKFDAGELGSFPTKLAIREAVIQKKSLGGGALTIINTTKMLRFM
jgi:hypothetical protein